MVKLTKEKHTMVTLLLIIIYIAFISLGLPDSLLGSAWPIVHIEFGVPVSYAGIVSMLIAFCTIISSLLSDRTTKRFGVGLVVSISVLLTAIGLFGFSISNKFYMLLIFAIPYGLGGGSIDAALNNYVALHFTSRHMNWLHCFWGVGAAIGPYIMSAFLLRNESDWQSGYRLIFYIQVVLSLVMFLSIPLWKKKEDIDQTVKEKPKTFKEIFRIHGVIYVMIAFFLYCGLEASSMLWGSTYLVKAKDIDEVSAAAYASLFVIGISAGRFISGLISNRLGDKKMIRIGLSIILLGLLLMIIFKQAVFSLIGLVTIGLGCAPVYPSIIHSTPSNFGKENSQALVGVQMASAYVGTSLMPPFFGLISNLERGINFFPYFILIMALLLVLMMEILYIKVQKNIISING